MSAALQEVGPAYERKRYVGSSDIAGILGISPWQSRVSVWQKKTDNEAPREVSAPKKKLYQRGKVWESVVAEMFVAELESNDHKVKVLNTNKRYIDPALDFCAAEIDLEIQLDDIPDVVNVELKTVSPFAARHWGESFTDEVPLWYAAQGMFGMMVTGRKCCVLAPLFGADEIRTFIITRDEETIAGMRQQADLFWNQYVVPRIAPEPASLDDVDRLFKKSNETVVTAEPWVVDKLMQYRAVEAEISAREAERDLAEYEIKKFMRDATVLRLPGQDKNAVTWKTQTASRVNVDALKSAYPKVYRECLRDGISRPFKVNKFTLGTATDD